MTPAVCEVVSEPLTDKLPESSNAKMDAVLLLLMI
jgi:hypothetical protein